MNWSNAADFFAMGGYGLYVWGAFGVTAAAMLGEMLSLRGRRRALRQQGMQTSARVDTVRAFHEA